MSRGCNPEKDACDPFLWCRNSGCSSYFFGEGVTELGLELRVGSWGTLLRLPISGGTNSTPKLSNAF